MTPRFWHAISARLDAHKKRLLRVALWGALSIGTLFGSVALLLRSEEWVFLALWLSVLHLFWCAGLAMVTQQYRTLAQRTDRGWGGTWRWLMQWYGAVFFGAWFSGLILMTLLGPFLIVGSYHGHAS